MRRPVRGTEIPEVPTQTQFIESSEFDDFFKYSQIEAEIYDPNKGQRYRISLPFISIMLWG